jgi:hypothetical protein
MTKMKTNHRVSTLLEKNNIQANIMTKWDRTTNRNCKFEPGAQVQVKKQPLHRFHSQRQAERIGEKGVVIGVSSPDGMRIRGSNGRRQYTRYYVSFNDAWVCGYDSHLLK